MAKKVKAIVKLNVPAGKANPAPPIGPALAGHGINIMQFCKEYNARTQSKIGDIIPAEITVNVISVAAERCHKVTTFKVKGQNEVFGRTIVSNSLGIFRKR